jgi:putative ABC transport system permease protein
MFAGDIRFAVRTYRRSPGFTLTALAAIALGIGATTAVFSVTDRILFRSLPYEDDKQLVSFGMLARVVDGGEFLFAADYKDLHNSNTPFQSLTSWSGVEDCDITDRSPLRQRCAEVDWSFLPLLGVRPILGGNFSRLDVQPGASRTVLLSYGLWQRHFGGDRTIAGKTLQLDGTPAQIAGVLPASFELPTLEHADLLTPQIILPAGLQPGSTRILRPIGRLKPGLTLEAARAQLGGFFQHVVAKVPAPFRKEVQFRVRSVRDRQMGNANLPAWTLLCSVVAVLLISCANLANLLLARAAGRRTELAVRSALGITRWQLARQMLTESLLLSVSGGVLGCVLAAVLLRVVLSVNAGALPHLADASLDVRVLAASLAISVIAGLLFGFAPALIEPKLEDLRTARFVSPRSSTMVKSALIASQIALSIVLVSAAILLMRSLWNLEAQPLGMETGHVLSAQLVLPSSRYKKPEERFAFFNQVEQRLTTIPGLRAAGLSDSLPPGGWERSRPFSALYVIGRGRPTSGTGGLVTWRYVSPGYFDALRIPVLKGRLFNEQDRDGANACILSHSLARRLFPGGDAIGQHLEFGTRPFEIVGVVPDVKNNGLTASDNPEYYIVRAHTPDETYRNSTGPVAQRTLSIVLRGAISDSALAAAIRECVATIDPTLPIEIQPMHQRLGEMAAGPRLYAILLSVFAVIGLLLAGIGLYGTISYLMVQRTQEIGIRMSLGATPARIASMMFSYSAKLTLTGAAAGVFGSFFATRLLRSLLFGVSAHDPLTLILSIACLCAAALAAAANPARRAARLDPMIALRTEK